MKRRIGILTSGGDCPGLNACIRGVARASYSISLTRRSSVVQDGYAGLIAGDYKEMKQSDFSGILTSAAPFRHSAARRSATCASSAKTAWTR